MPRKSTLPSLGLFDAEEVSDETRQSPSTTPASVSQNVTKMKWSHSKRGVLEQCPRKFYYQYYGAHRSKAKNDPAKQRLHELKMTVNRHTRTGEILHLAIADYFRKAQDGTPWERQNLLDWGQKIFERDVSRSIDGLDAPVVSHRNHPPKFLIEFVQEVEPRQLCREATTEMSAALNTFLDASAFAAVRELGVQQGAFIEKHFHSLKCFPFSVEGQIDMAHRAPDGSVTLVDWKSGEDFGDGDDSLQLAVYALWATEAFNCEAKDVTLYKAFLGSGTLVEFPLSDALLKTARLKILQDAECFARMHDYGCAGAVEAFTPCAQEAVCRGCVFATMCPEGKESLT